MNLINIIYLINPINLYDNLSKILRLNQHWNDSPHRFPGDILDDYNRFRFGGTCFSLTYFLKTILDYYGYATDVVITDMKAGKNSHCALILKFDGELDLKVVNRIQ
ncbi:MAG: hypothetical protein WC703_10950 [Candidatus Neomarinimicrobiota bacterium]